MKKILTSILLLSLLFTLTSCGSAGEAAATNRLEEIIQKGVITVAMEPYFAPNEFIDSSLPGDEQYVGSDVEFAKYIAEKLGVELQIVPLEFGAVLSSVSEGKYDLAISALAFTPARAESMELSKGYYFSTDDLGYGLLIREEDAGKIRTLDDLADKIVIAQSGSIQEALIQDNVTAYKEFKRVSATPDGYLSVSEGKADVACCSIAHAQLYIEANSDCGLTVVEDFQFDLPEEYDGTRVGAQKGAVELIAFVNECIDDLLASGQYAAWVEKYKAYAASLGV
ncbi:MAG: transporter substrate-binding domain-containing protein [Oscillospiraceae bacterium]|nr:transporter substrate-binding domain-containing protein [Oscillospiraceae bacterium]